MPRSMVSTIPRYRYFELAERHATELVAESFVREGNMVVFENVTELDGHVLSRTVATHRCRPNGEVKTVTEE